MGILADFFVSTEDLAPNYNSTRWPAGDYFRSGDFIPMHLEMLWAILQRREWDVDLVDEFKPIGEYDDGEVWLVRFPDDLVTRLAEATPAQLDSARVEWAATEELGADPDDLIEPLQALRELSLRAISTGRSVYLYGSL